MESFPIPQQPVDIGALQSNMEAQQGILSTIGGALANGVQAVLQQQQNLAARPVGRCCRQILLYIQQQDAILQQTFQQIYGVLQNVLSEQNVLVRQTAVYQQTVQGGGAYQGGSVSQSRPQSQSGSGMASPLPGMPAVPGISPSQTGGHSTDAPPASQSAQPGYSGFGVIPPRVRPIGIGDDIGSTQGTLPSAPYAPYSAPQHPVIPAQDVAVSPQIPPTYTSPNGQTVVNLTCPAPVVNVTCPQCGTNISAPIQSQEQQQAQQQSQQVNIEFPPPPLSTGDSTLCDIQADEFLANKNAVMIIPYGTHKGRDASPDSECGQLIMDEAEQPAGPVGPIADAVSQQRLAEFLFPEDYSGAYELPDQTGGLSLG